MSGTPIRAAMYRVYMYRGYRNMSVQAMYTGEKKSEG
jgi:hypothetical protein